VGQSPKDRQDCGSWDRVHGLAQVVPSSVQEVPSSVQVVPASVQEEEAAVVLQKGPAPGLVFRALVAQVALGATLARARNRVQTKVAVEFWPEDARVSSVAVTSTMLLGAEHLLKLAQHPAIDEMAAAQLAVEVVVFPIHQLQLDCDESVEGQEEVVAVMAVAS